MINKVILLGNLGADPEVRHLESGASVAKFRMATNRNYRDKNGEWQKITQWHNVVAWRQLAERVERDLKKGGLVFVEGELTHRKYQDKDGVEKYATEIVAYTIRSLEKREGEGQMGASSSGFTTVADPGTNKDEGPEMDDDLPF